MQDEALQRLIDGRLRRRLLPEIRKAFQATGLQREGYRIAGYEARAGGYLNPHRDNSTPTNANRRFTMTVNFNAGEYEGGELRFREYGEQLYAVERGTAIVWSASLLHEVLPVTKGRRLVLGVHMFAGLALPGRVAGRTVPALCDRSFDQCAIGFHQHAGIRADPRRFRLHLLQHIRDACLVAHLVAASFDARRFFDVVEAVGQ